MVDGQEKEKYMGQKKRIYDAIAPKSEFQNRLFLLSKLKDLIW